MPPSLRKDVALFQSELRCVQVAILCCDELEEPDVQTIIWADQLRDLAYDIEDWLSLVDDGTHDADTGTSSRFTRWFRRGVRRLTTVPDRLVIATEPRELWRRVLEVAERRKRYSYTLILGPQIGRAGSHYADPRLITSHADSASLVGMDGPRSEVVEMVTAAGSDGLKVVSIVGMAGSGKTTLAREVYGLVGEGFDCRASVRAGRSSDIAKVLGDMLFQVDRAYRGRAVGAYYVDMLISELADYFKDKRYLVMVDDVWSVQDWEIINECFPENNLGSRIITTTRIEAVANAAGDRVYRTRLLGEADAEALFSRTIFGSVGRCPPHFKDVSAQIMRKCGGLPLAIVSVGGLLASKAHTRDEFERSGLKWRENSELEGMTQIIKLSYNDLPPHLRPCLLHLSIFPDNHEIEIERLARRLTAEGLISECCYRDMEETATDYIYELIDRNLIQPSRLNHDGTHRSCIVHPVIHDFIVCMSTEDNFVALAHAQQKFVPRGYRTIRHMSLLNSGKYDQAAAQIDGAKVSRARSITVFAHTGGMPRLNYLSVLRVLDLEDCEGPLCLDGLCGLLLLRYLNLKGTDVSKLPAKIGELRCLETLDVRSTKVKELPPSILKMEMLKHLLAGNARLPTGIGMLRSVLTVSCSNIGMSADADILQELGEMASLRELELFCNLTQMSEDQKQVTFSSDGFKSLRKLSIRCNSPSVTFMTGALSKVRVLELKLEQRVLEKSRGVYGIEHLSHLKRMLMEFSQHDAGAAAAMAVVRKVVETVHPSCEVITVNIDN
ncbi:disease resistance protein RGA5-like [Triticum urartu]|nr:disease resistance protein RGA5-like [Triticum urartu]